jgi:aldehyde:ferredoxin oxidoreductase
MGSKNLKAIVLNGDKKPSVADEKKVDELIKTVRNNMLNSAFLPGMRENGQPGAFIPNYESGATPIKNWTQSEWESGIKRLGTPVYNEELNVKSRACAFCVMGCKRLVKVEDGSPYDHEGPGPEYETMAMMGSNLLIDDLKKFSFMNDLCNRYGIDTMSTGQILAMVFELYEKKIIDKKFLDGIEAKWGDADAAIMLIEKIGKCEGIGKELGKGTRHLKTVIGGEEAEEAAVEVKGVEMSGHDPRAHHSMAVTYATSSRGPCHVRGFSKMVELGVTIPEIGIDEAEEPLGPENKGLIAAKIMDMNTIHNSLVWCLVIPFADVDFKMQVDILNSITGWNMTPKDLIKAGERISNIMHIINLRRGLTRKDMRLPKRFLKVSLNDSKIPRKIPEIDKMLDNYFDVRSWDNNAIPLKEKMHELGLGEYIS